MARARSYIASAATALVACVALASAGVPLVHAAGLVDHAIQSTAGQPVYIDSTGGGVWRVASSPTGPVHAHDAGDASSRVVDVGGSHLPAARAGGDDGAIAGAHVDIAASVPGDLLTDLQTAGVIGDPLFDVNFRNASAWAGKTWTYSTTFATPEDLTSDPGDSVLLVFDGIKMGAEIRVNGKLVATAVDQFLRYSVPLAMAGTGANDAGEQQAASATASTPGIDSTSAVVHRVLKPRPSADVDAATAATNTLTVTFDPSICVDGRFMACTGGWDWAPYSTVWTSSVGSPGVAFTFTLGVWKSVYLVTVPAKSAAATHVVPEVFYTGAYPQAPLKDGAFAPFTVAVRTHFWAAAATQVSVLVSGGWGDFKIGAVVDVPPGDSNHTLNVTATDADVKLWWPAGMGSQPLYNVSVSFTPYPPTHRGLDGAPGAVLLRRVGFRHFALVTGNDTDPAWVAANKDVDGTDSLGMRFRVNGAAMWSRGGNMIPMDAMEGRYDVQAHVTLVQSAVAAGMNTFRVWGGGIYYPDVFYDTADEEGVLLYHDIQFAQEGHSPNVTATQAAEFRHQVRRLSHHPSLALIDGCNECVVRVGTPTGIYATFVLRVVAEELTSRVVWPSCPAEGWASGVNRLTAMPNGSPKGLVPGIGASNKEPFETHGPYLQGSGFGQVNAPGKLQMFPSNIPPALTNNTATGLALPGVYASEFGTSVMSSFESMSATLSPQHWGLHSGQPEDSCVQEPGRPYQNCSGTNVMGMRNHACDSLNIVYFNDSAAQLGAVGEQAFKGQLYRCMISQALNMKSNIEVRRSGNEHGTVIWQLGEIWPTGGWGSLEYGTPVAGQVRGGRWKPLHYWLMNSLFADVIVSCSDGGGSGAGDAGAWFCFVKNDRAAEAFDGTVSIQAVQLSTGKATHVVSRSVNLAQGPGVTAWFDASAIGPALVPGDSILLASVEAAGVAGSAPVVVSRNFIAVEEPYKLTGLKASNVAATVAAGPNPDGTVNVTVTTDAVALWVTLTTAAHGRFSDNAFVALPGKATVQFMPFGSEKVDIATLRSTLRVEDVSTYR